MAGTVGQLGHTQSPTVLGDTESPGAAPAPLIGGSGLPYPLPHVRPARHHRQRSVPQPCPSWGRPPALPRCPRRGAAPRWAPGCGERPELRTPSGEPPVTRSRSRTRSSGARERVSLVFSNTTHPTTSARRAMPLAALAAQGHRLRGHGPDHGSRSRSRCRHGAQGAADARPSPPLRTITKPERSSRRAGR